MHKAFVSIWLDFYREKTGQNYLFNGKDGKHIKILIKMIEAKVKERGMEPTEENMTNSFKGFLMLIQDKWILDNLEVSIVSSKFNSLYARAIKSNPFTQRDRITEILRKSNS